MGQQSQKLITHRQNNGFNNNLHNLTFCLKTSKKMQRPTTSNKCYIRYIQEQKRTSVINRAKSNILFIGQFVLEVFFSLPSYCASQMLHLTNISNYCYTRECSTTVKPFYDDCLTFCQPNKNQGPVSRRSRELYGPEKPDLKLQSTCFEKSNF